MKLLLVSPTVDTCYEYAPPIGLMNLYLIAKDLKIDVELMDLSRVSYKKSLEKILAKQYDIIGISCNFTNAALNCMNYAKDIKKKYPNTLLISGGNHATLLPEDLLFNGYDYILYSEGEVTFKKFLQNILDKKSVKSLKGIYYLKDEKIIKNPPRDLIKDLDSLPLNDYSEFDMNPYFKLAKMRYINIETSRGCIYNCAFCATVKMWRHKFRTKSPERVLKEFKIAKKNKYDFVWFVDDDTAIDEENLRNICKLLIKEQIDIPWGTTLGSNSIKNESTYDLMKRSKCIKINICIESANPRILKEYRKPYTIEDNRRTCLNFIKRGILVHNHGIVGAPNETFRESLNTYFYLIKTSPMWHNTILEPRPGTYYWDEWDKKGDPSQYNLFGKANIILPKTKFINYFTYRFFALYYFLNPIRIQKAFFNKNKAIRYFYRIQYDVAYRTVKENFLSFLRRFKIKSTLS